MTNVIDFNEKSEELTEKACCDWIGALLSGDKSEIESKKKRMDELGIEVSNPIPLDELDVDLDLSRYTNEMLAESLEEYNKWRRGGEGEQPSPKFLGFVIEETIKRLRK